MIGQSTILLLITVALVGAVEAVEALTIILAAGIAGGWRVRPFMLGRTFFS